MNEITIHEVGMRDGLQMENEIVPTDLKIKWIKSLIKSGLPYIQIGSFVHPKYVPQMADTDKLFNFFNQPENKTNNTVLSALVLNLKGIERGLACGTEMFCMGVSASETHSMKNTRMDVTTAIKEILNMADLAHQAKKQIQLSVQSAFGCGYEGPVSEDKVIHIVSTYLEAGYNNISLADTAGHATPGQVKSLLEKVQKLAPGIEITGHFHNTYGMAIANCFAAMESGVHTLDSSFAGLGGCPFTSVAGGNVCTEDLVHMLQRMGIGKNLNLDILIRVAQNGGEFFKRDLPGMIYKTGSIDQQLSHYRNNNYPGGKTS